MIAIQIGIIIFLVSVLMLVFLDEKKKIKLERKSAKLKMVWDPNRERRRNVRINSEIDVLYELNSTPSTRRCTSISKNISMGGMNLVLSEKLFPETILNLQLNVTTAPKPIFVQGQIVWVKEIAERFIKEKGERIFAAGIKFVKIAPEMEAALRNFINQQIKESPEKIQP